MSPQRKQQSTPQLEKVVLVLVVYEVGHTTRHTRCACLSATHRSRLFLEIPTYGTFQSFSTSVSRGNINGSASSFFSFSWTRVIPRPLWVRRLRIFPPLPFRRYAPEFLPRTTVQRMTCTLDQNWFFCCHVLVCLAMGTWVRCLQFVGTGLS